MNDQTNIRQWLLIALPWASIPLLAVHFASVWNALPQQIPTHFGPNGRPNGWQSPVGLASFAFILLAFLLAIFSFAIVRAYRSGSMARAVTVFAYAMAGIEFTVFWQLLDHAAYGTAMSDVWPMPLAIPILGFVIMTALMAPGNSASASPSRAGVLIAEEQHRSPLPVLFAAPGAVIGFWLVLRAGPGRWIGVVLIATMAWMAVVILDGFRYLVRSDGVQIRGFLLPLRFIPKASIHSYRTQQWNGLGYGIRLTPTGTAYIWGGKSVVNIATDRGDIMLGHEHPERLIHDLDRMMKT